MHWYEYQLFDVPNDYQYLPILTNGIQTTLTSTNTANI